MESRIVYPVTTAYQRSSYVDRIKRSILLHQKRHPRALDQAEIEAFLTHLAAEPHIAASIQNQARSAPSFLV